MESENINVNVPENESEDTNLTISEETLVIIVKMAVLAVEGVTGMSATITEELAEAFGKKSQGKGIRIDQGESGLIISLSIIAKFGFRIPDIAWNVQEKVRDDILAMTEYKVESINVYVQGIDFT